MCSVDIGDGDCYDDENDYDGDELEFHISDENNDSKVIITSKLKCTFEFI